MIAFDKKNKKLIKKCNHHGDLLIDEIYITEKGTHRCLICKNERQPIIKQKSNIEFIGLKELKCNKCKVIKPLEEFYKNSTIYSPCKPCKRIQRSEYRKRPEVREKEYIYEMKKFYKKKYGITFDDYDEMFKKQRGLCAICRKTSSKIDSRSKKIQRFHVDHCHKTKKIRGLLCTKCNQGLGFFDDNILFLESCIKYLLESNK